VAVNVAPMPEVIYAQASPKSIGGVSLFEGGARIDRETVGGFTSDEGLIRSASDALRAAGFDVLQVSPLTINIAGPRERYEEVFGAKLVTDERPVIKGGAVEDTATFIDTVEPEEPGLIDTSASPLRDLLEGVALEEPRYYHENAFGPPKAYWHLDVPGDVSLGCNADRAHRTGVTGLGMKVVMCDTGWYAHPFFTQRGYRAAPAVLGPAAANPADDEVGHGTAESANVFAVAPDVDFTMVKMSFVNTIGAFNAAVALAPHIVSNSWGSSVRTGPLSAADQALAAAIALAVSNGIVVVFSAGNGHWGFPGQHPDVISAGGTYMEADGSMRASDYSSGFASNVYAGRNVPDVCGLVGMLPRAAYIMLPLQPGDQIDQGLAGGTHPNGDETAPDDGWAAISGTSAAAPQLAGVCALVKQACPALSPADVRDVLRATARDVTAGTCNPNTGGNPAGPGPDLATGHGLVDAHAAVTEAKARCGGT
jgi:subtilisin family serine protease